MPDEKYQEITSQFLERRPDLVDDLIDGLPRSDGMRNEIEGAASRRDFARWAARLAEDRYSAGSQAATLAIIILHRFGTEAALNFVRDLCRHEGF